MVCVEEVLKIEKGVERLLILVMIYFNEKNLSNKGRFVECKYCLSQTSDLIKAFVMHVSPWSFQLRIHYRKKTKTKITWLVMIQRLLSAKVY